MNDRTSDLKLGEESIPPNEEDLIDRIVALHRAVQELSDRKRKPVPRGQHPKAHGCVKAEFTVRDDLPEAYRYGIFRSPTTYQALIRFSNAIQWDDSKPDVHAMAIKLLNTEGERVPGSEPGEETQDFIMIDAPVFFIRNVVDYVPFMEDFLKIKTPGLSFGKAAALGRFLLSPDYRYRMMRASPRLIDNPLSNRYWSTTPSKLGESAMKFSTRPIEANAFSQQSEHPDQENRLRHAMSDHLKTRTAKFEFLIQLQTDPVAMPIEDPTVAWDEAASPYRAAATIQIPPQSFESQEQMTFCENLSFTPWHSLAAHRPLGGVNRTRRRVYQAISQRRHELNGAPMAEPRADGSA